MLRNGACCEQEGVSETALIRDFSVFYFHVRCKMFFCHLSYCHALLRQAILCVLIWQITFADGCYYGDLASGKWWEEQESDVVASE